MTDFFTSDLHFGHTNILSYTDRPWGSVEEMDEALVTAWNDTVTRSDRVFVLGDVSFHNGAETHKLLGRLRGQKFLIQGNHDHSKRLAETTHWNWIRTRHTHAVDGAKIVMDHFPSLSWLGQSHGYYHLHGHCHGDLTLPESLQNARILDVGVDAVVKWAGSYRPVAWDEVKAHLSEKQY